MVPNITGLWLIDKTGLPLLNRVYETNDDTSLIDSALFSGFITAIVAFSQQVVKDTIDTIQMAGHDIHYLSFNKFSVVATSKKSVPNILEIHKILSEIGNKFQKHYQEELDCIERNTETFENFGSYVDQILQNKHGKQKSLNNFEIGLILTEVKFNKLTPQEAINRIYNSFKKLDKKSQSFIKDAMKDFEVFFSEKSGLSKEEIVMYKEIVGKMTALMKSEKFMQSF